MEVKQIYEIVNSVSNEVLGKTDLVNEDLSNIVDLGNEVINTGAIDNYVKSLVNHIGKVIFVNRVYKGNAPSVLMDAWEYGSILEKISADIPESVENKSWDLTDNTQYNQDIFYKPKVSAKFFNNKITFEIPMSFTEKQVKESFSSATQLNGFMSMLHNTVEKAMTINIDNLIMRCINNMIAETLVNEYGVEEHELNPVNTSSKIKAVNLLYEYNTNHSSNLTAIQAIQNPEFIRYATYRIGLYISRLSKISTLFNIGNKARFTPEDKLHVILLNDFANAANVYLQSDTIHDNYVKLPNAEMIPFWQGSGLNYDFSSVSAIDVKTANGDTVSISGLLAVMFDTEACAVCNTDKRVTTAYNAKGEFFNNFYKYDCSYFNDTNENFVCFFVA